MATEGRENHTKVEHGVTFSVRTERSWATTGNTFRATLYSQAVQCGRILAGDGIQSKADKTITSE